MSVPEQAVSELRDPRTQSIAAHPMLINEVGVKHVEFVTLDDLRRRIVVVVVCLIVLVPLVASFDAVEIPWLARTVLVVPPIHLIWDSDLLRGRSE